MVYMVFGSIAITCCPALALFRTAGMQNLPTKAEVLVLDFDNCLILDPETREGSEDLKKSAWFRVFPYEPGELSQAIDEAYRQIAGGKGDRRDVVRFVLQRCGVLRNLGVENAIERTQKRNWRFCLVLVGWESYNARNGN